MTDPDYVGFAKAIFLDWPDSGLDGFDLQEIGEKHGVLVPEKRTKLCEPECTCAEYYTSEDVKAGFTCYRVAWATALDHNEQDHENP